MKTIILDPGHGLANRRAGRFDPGAVSEGIREADIVMDWANDLRRILRAAGHRVIRTRAHPDDPAPLGQRARIARDYGGDIMLSLHCNAANGQASGTETFYRGTANRPLATAINLAVVECLHTRNRGAKLEAASQHGRLAIMAFQPTFLLEIGFIDHPGDRLKMQNPVLRRDACRAIAKLL